MFTYVDVIIIIFLHFLFDWGFQPRKWADKKHNEPRALLAHVFIVTLGLIVIGWHMNLGEDIVPFLVINVLLHTVTDWISSGVYKNLVDGNKLQASIAVVALDQFIHLAVLFWSLNEYG